MVRKVTLTPELPKLLLLGYGEAGKDTIADRLSEYGFRITSSSYFCAEKLMMPYFTSIGKPYASVEECYLDRQNHRSVWFDVITNYNSGSWDKLSLEILKHYDVYNGMRNYSEYVHSAYLYDYVVWVDASERVPVENKSSCELTEEVADYIIDNNSPLENLDKEIKKFINFLLKR